MEIDVPNELDENDFYADIHGLSCNLESVNSIPTKSYNSKIHFVHNVCWHPVKIILLWLIIFVIVVLLVWFLLLKRIIYPRIRLSRIEFKCEEICYYESKRINSARKVIVSPNKINQSWLNKLFTGKIICISNGQVWPTQWEILPKAASKTAKIDLHGKYTISPYALELKNLGEYVIQSKEVHHKITAKII